MEMAPAETPAAAQGVTVGTPAAEETPAVLEGVTVETPPAEGTPAAIEPAPAGTPAADDTPAAEQTPPATGAAPVETPPAEETPAAIFPGVTEGYGGEPTVGAGVSEQEEAEKKALEGAEVEDEAEAYADMANRQAAVEEGGGLSREEVVRWLEIGLGTGVGVLVVLWAFARLQRSIGNRP